MAGEVKRCVVCGCELKSRHWNAKYCDGCNKRIKKDKQREYERRHRCIQKRKDLGKRDTVSMTADIEQLAQEARKAGMSYGQYVAKREVW